MSRYLTSSRFDRKMKTKAQKQLDRQTRQTRHSPPGKDLRPKTVHRISCDDQPAVESGITPRRSRVKSNIVLATVAETVRAIQDEKLSLSNIDAIVTRVAVDCGATGGLLAAVKRYLPSFYVDVKSSNLDAVESVVLPPTKPQYEIWTQGQHKIVKDIKAYGEKKSKYLFWADITNGDYSSLGKQRLPLSPNARRLLLYLAENIGLSVPRSVLFECVIGVQPEEGWKNRLSHYLTELQNFAAGNFRKLYLPPPDQLTDTLTLRKAFKNQYFVFVTWKQPEQ
jgi:hypothetical protein